jgi:hypothetical protein
VDVIAGDATSGLIKALDLTMLDDNRRYFPPYYAVPVVRSAALLAHPEVRDALMRLAGKISETDMRAMNAAVDVEHRDVKEDGEEYLAVHPSSSRFVFSFGFGQAADGRFRFVETSARISLADRVPAALCTKRPRWKIPSVGIDWMRNRAASSGTASVFTFRSAILPRRFSPPCPAPAPSRDTARTQGAQKSTTTGSGDAASLRQRSLHSPLRSARLVHQVQYGRRRTVSPAERLVAQPVHLSARGAGTRTPV